MALTLYGSLGSPWTRKLMIAMYEKGIECMHPVKANGHAEPPPAGLWPLGKTPVLMLDNGSPVFDSGVIVEFLEAIQPMPCLLGRTPDDRAVIRTWEALADGFADIQITAPVDAAHGRVLKQRATDAIEWMAKHLAEKEWLAGGAFSFADVTIATVLLWHERRSGDSAWRAQYANLDRLTKKLAERRSFVETYFVEPSRAAA